MPPAAMPSNSAVSPGKNICVFTNNDTAYHAARDVAERGGKISLIVDVRADVSADIRAIAAATGAELFTGSAVGRTGGVQKLSSVRVAGINVSTAKLIDHSHRFEADCLMVSGGWSPTIHLTSQFGGKPRWRKKLQTFLPGKPLQPWFGAGAMSGRFGLARAIETGSRAAGKALSSMPVSRHRNPACLRFSATMFVLRPRRFSRSSGRTNGARASSICSMMLLPKTCVLPTGKAIFRLKHLKRYTTLGMATDQGKTSNVSGLAIMADARGEPIDKVGTTRFRPPYTPVAIGAIAGESFGHLQPYRLTPMHDRHAAKGAHMVANGLWMRPESYNQPGETVEQAYIREAAAVRAGVGLVDVSTLGKIDIQGPDATELH